MQNTSKISTRESHSTHERRYWRRTDEAEGWWPWGLLPLLGLLLLFLYGALRTAPVIQAATESSVAAALGDHGVDVLELSGDGQIVNIVAAAPEAAEAAIRGTASLTNCDTWVGELRCPTEIKLTLRKTEAPAPDGPAARYHDFEFSRAANTVRLQGEVATADVQAQLLSVAQNRFAIVVDHLIVSSDLATTGYEPASERALMLLENFDRGNVRWSQGVFSATGMVEAADEDISREIFQRDDGALSLGELDLQVIASVSSCNEEFASILGNTSIRFRTSSAVIDDRSQSLLADLAAVARKCPGQLVIEGHTDDRGGDDANQRLSLSRAEAVSSSFATLGIASDRLTSVGYGETRPIASNATQEGRAENRRIAIRIADSGTK